MVRQPRRIDTQGIVPPADEALLRHACPDLDEWPQRWQYDAADLAPGAAIVATFTPFLLDLLHGALAKRTFNRHRDNLWLLGGEMIRRRYDDPALKRLPAQLLVRRLIDAEGGPLISSLLSEAEQAAVDATCRKLHQFLTRANAVERGKVTHKFR